MDFQPDSLLEQVIHTIVQRFHPRRLILFGSRARGESHSGSDTDLFIEMDTPLGRWQRSREVRSALGLMPASFDILVYTPDEVRRLRALDSALLADIEREGVVLYDAGEGAPLARQG